MIKIKKILSPCNFFRTVRAFLLFEEAWDQLARNNAKNAEVVFSKAEIFLNKGGVIMELSYEHKIMKGYIKFNLKKRQECYNILKEAWYDIEGDEKISTADRMYLQEYIYGIVELFRRYLDADISFTNPIYPEDIKLSEVSKNLKRRFPSRDHPDWDKYGV